VYISVIQLFIVLKFPNKIFSIPSPAYVYQLTVVVTSCLPADPHAGAPEPDGEFLLNLVWGLKPAHICPTTYDFSPYRSNVLYIKRIEIFLTTHQALTLLHEIKHTFC
jgi:hypothetical protein